MIFGIGGLGVFGDGLIRGLRYRGIGEMGDWGIGGD